MSITHCDQLVPRKIGITSPGLAKSEWPITRNYMLLTFHTQHLWLLAFEEVSYLVLLLVKQSASVKWEWLTSLCKSKKTDFISGVRLGCCWILENCDRNTSWRRVTIDEKQEVRRIIHMYVCICILCICVLCCYTNHCGKNLAHSLQWSLVDYESFEKKKILSLLHFKIPSCTFLL